MPLSTVLQCCRGRRDRYLDLSAGRAVCLKASLGFSDPRIGCPLRRAHATPRPSSQCSVLRSHPINRNAASIVPTTTRGPNGSRTCGARTRRCCCVLIRQARRHLSGDEWSAIAFPCRALSRHGRQDRVPAVRQRNAPAVDFACNANRDGCLSPRPRRINVSPDDSERMLERGIDIRRLCCPAS